MPDDAAFQPYFLGPKAENETWAREAFEQTLGDWFAERHNLFRRDPPAIADGTQGRPAYRAARARMEDGLDALVTRLRGELPAYTPRYMGHMSSELALPGLLGHFAALLHNPNNTSKEASRVGTVIEAEAIARLAAMIGYDPARARGHFTSGGTVANLEAAWRARYRLDHRLALGVALAEGLGAPLDVFAAAHRPAAQAAALPRRYGLDERALRAASGVVGNPLEVAARIGRLSGRPYRGPVMLVPGHKHYSWVKAANLLGLGEEAFWPVALDRTGRLCPDALTARIDEARGCGRPVLMVVSVAGTTEMGELDPVDAVAARLAELRDGQEVEIWHHVDAAYGGFLCALDPDEPLLAPPRRTALAAIRTAETVTIDPHKLGYAPYACGALLAREAACDTVSAFSAPYIDRAELGDAPWMHTLEGSRPATGAAATWLIGETLGFGPAGLGGVLRGTLASCRALRAGLCRAAPEIRPLDPMDTNIFCFSVARPGEALSAANARTAAVQARIAASPSFSMSRTVLSAATHGALIADHVASYGGRVDADRLVLVRCVVMNPFWAQPSVQARLLPELAAELASLVQQEPEAALRRHAGA
jgi:glutamate/tyrosine decarboxylase-like PLP-dependent enzyme